MLNAEPDLLQLLNGDVKKLWCQRSSKSGSWGVVQTRRDCVHCCSAWGPAGVSQSARVCVAATGGQSTKTSHLFPIKLAGSVAHGGGPAAQA